MRVEKAPKADNAEYNIAISLIIPRILLPKNPEYYGSTLPKDTPDIRKDMVSQNAEKLKAEDDNVIENFLFETLTDDSIDKLIIAGVLGAGKTSLINHIVANMLASGYSTNTTKIYEAKGLIFYCDIMKLSSDPSHTSPFLTTVSRELNSFCRSLFYDIIENKNFVDLFFNYIKENKGDLTWPYRFREMIEPFPTENLKEHLLNFVKTKDESTVQQIIKDCVYYYTQIFRDGHKSILVIFDNLDAAEGVDQQACLTYMLKFAHGSALKILLAMRPTTFGKVSQSSIPFYYLLHSGHEPSYVLSKRLETFIKDPYKYLNVSKLAGSYLLALIDRCKEVVGFIKNNGRLYRVINAVCGDSKRKILTMAHNLFINTQCKYSNPITEDQMIQLLFVFPYNAEPEEAIKIFNSNPLTMNAFTGDTATNSLIKIRILQILYHNLKHNDNSARLGELISFCQLFDGYTDSQIYSVVSEMIEEKKCVLFVPGVTEYKKIDEFFRSTNDYIALTSSGKKYLKDLITELQYLQNCFYAIEWSVEKINAYRPNLVQYLKGLKDKITDPKIAELVGTNISLLGQRVAVRDFVPVSYAINVADFVERIQLVRGCLKLLLLEDLTEMMNYFENEKRGFYIVNGLITQQIIAACYASVTHIAGTYVNPGLKNELEEWENLNLIASNWNLILRQQHRN